MANREPVRQRASMRKVIAAPTVSTSTAPSAGPRITPICRPIPFIELAEARRSRSTSSWMITV